MSDVADWSTVNSGQSQEIASGPFTASAGVGQEVVTLGSIPPLTRGFKVLITLPAAGDVILSSVIFLGSTTSFQSYGELSTDTEFAWAYVPGLGAADTTGVVYINYVNNAGGPVACAYQVVALPDFVERGAPDLPVYVTPGTGVVFPVVSDYTNALGSTGTGVSATTSAQTLVSPPASGKARILDLISLTGVSALMTVSFNGPTEMAVEAAPLTATHTNQPFNPNWVMTPSSPNLTVATSTGTATVWASWHDVELGLVL